MLSESRHLKAAITALLCQESGDGATGALRGMPPKEKDEKKKVR